MARWLPPRRPRPAPHPASTDAIDPRPPRSTRSSATTSRPCSARSTTGRLRSASLAMPGTNSSPISTAGFSVAQGQASRSRLCPTQMPCVQRNPAGGFQLQGARFLSVVYGETDEWRERSPWGAQSLALGHHGSKSDRARAAAFNPALAQGQASRRQWVLTFPFSWRPRLAQEREACPWGTVNCSVGSPRSSSIARSLPLGHGAGVLCPSSGAGGRHGCEDGCCDRGTEDVIRHALKPSSAHNRPRWRLARERQRACGPRPGCALFAGLGHLRTSEVGNVLERAVRRIERHLSRCGLLGTTTSAKPGLGP